MCKMKHRSTKVAVVWSLEPVCTAKNDAPMGENDTREPPSSDLLI